MNTTGMPQDFHQDVGDMALQVGIIDFEHPRVQGFCHVAGLVLNQ
jgi:hypothetical protein